MRLLYNENGNKNIEIEWNRRTLPNETPLSKRFTVSLVIEIPFNEGVLNWKIPGYILSNCLAFILNLLFL
jgi:hypothetical protein